ncbi:hypothetical protein TGME49_255930 [Toxoplasma gondii ME49]|uniref:Uncharacterized protein n=3 Tax=Toxoplasma gondii TaxID=5811 RepID=B6KAR7_TOXGV|nr:hypothetical protein TGME49_255930 [Toxoplasma gondii ME49]EPT29186.1 hypothetical protein TGME49_255930 [Toxoplasma gondii ME49]ESS35440.1 hypothetical protein TGVEG_255930 [Toxoplasma gondii VEG]KYF45799.1 hypothetical protein TGARI_255930 [Toxoplasma gondii ARI]CEL74620.1 TPA: hypothetical protein BN1205_078230 [Toxoplasma gondii VEG]|eukprot:XP_002364901.1 hypothetical protein TGME49_255930 [Toxoplasma gondii ME49]
MTSLNRSAESPLPEERSVEKPQTPTRTFARQESPLTSGLSRMDRNDASFFLERTPLRASCFSSSSPANGSFCGQFVRPVQGERNAPLYVRLKRHREEDVPPFLCLLQHRGEGNAPAAKQQKVRGEYEGAAKHESGLLLFRHVGEPPVLLDEKPNAGHKSQDAQTASAAPHGSPRCQTTGKEELTPAASGASTAQGDIDTALLQRLRKYRVVPSGRASEDGHSKEESEHQSALSGTREGEKTAAKRRAGAVQHVRLADGRKIRLLDVCPSETVGGTEDRSDFTDDCDFEWYRLAGPDDAVHAAGERSSLFEFLEEEGGALSAQAELIRKLIASGTSANLADGPGADAVGLIELEDVDEETGEVLRGCGWSNACRSVDVFLGEFGDIDDPDSDDPDAAELDYPEDSDDERERRFAARVRHLIEDSEEDRFSESSAFSYDGE